MQSIGVISPVDEPTEWCAGMVVVPKSIYKVRICVDLGKLNECVKRERLMLPAVDQSLGQLRGAVVFSKLDANSGFWQIFLAKALIVPADDFHYSLGDSATIDYLLELHQRRSISKNKCNKYSPG